MSATTLARDLVVAQTRALKLPGVARTFEALARQARELTRLQQRLLRVDVLIVDELGFVPFDRVGGELLFNLITDRYERAPQS